MSDFRGFNESYQDHLKPEVDVLISKSHDIKKQLSQSIHGHTSGGGVAKPTSRKNSVLIKHSDDEDDEDEDKSNERKRRDNINDKIQELLTLIPPELFIEKEKSAPIKNDEDADIAAAMRNSGTKDGKPNKGQILTKSVEYLQQLQAEIDENNRKEVELIMRLRNLELKKEGKEGVPVSVGHTSAERALGEIGVGPLSEEYFKKVLKKSEKRRGSIG